MSPVYVKNGTPVEGQSLCISCNHSHIMRGFRESEELIFCNYVMERLLPLPFKIRECTSYADKNKPTWDQMEDLAIEIKPAVSYKPIGFKSKDRHEVVENDPEVATK